MRREVEITADVWSLLDEWDKLIVAIRYNTAFAATIKPENRIHPTTTDYISTNEIMQPDWKCNQSVFWTHATQFESKPQQRIHIEPRVRTIERLFEAVDGMLEWQGALRFGVHIS